MKPGNLAATQRCQIRRQTKDEDSILRTSSPSVCAFLLFRNRMLLHGTGAEGGAFAAAEDDERNESWKKDCLLPNV